MTPAVATAHKERRWKVLLTFESGAKFDSVEHEPTMNKALDSAIRYARACGWGAPVKRSVRELT